MGGYPLIWYPMKSRKRDSWAFSPGRAEATRNTRVRIARVVRHRVATVEIEHEVWKTGRGATDYLCINDPHVGSFRVIALEHHYGLNDQWEAKMGIGWRVSPTLVGPAIENGMPEGDDSRFSSEKVATVTPMIVTLSRLMANTMRCSITLEVGSCKEPRDAGKPLAFYSFDDGGW
jgi:hypothetical protein